MQTITQPSETDVFAIAKHTKLETSSGLAYTFRIVAGLEILGGALLIGGIYAGGGKVPLELPVEIGGGAILGTLFLLGCAEVLDRLHESTKRLQIIESLLWQRQFSDASQPVTDSK